MNVVKSEKSEKVRTNLDRNNRKRQNIKFKTIQKRQSEQSEPDGTW